MRRFKTLNPHTCPLRKKYHRRETTHLISTHSFRCSSICHFWSNHDLLKSLIIFCEYIDLRIFPLVCVSWGNSSIVVKGLASASLYWGCWLVIGHEVSVTFLTVGSFPPYGFVLLSITLLIYSKIRNYKSIKLTVTTHFVSINLINSKMLQFVLYEAWT